MNVHQIEMDKRINRRRESCHDANNGSETFRHSLKVIDCLSPRVPNLDYALSHLVKPTANSLIEERMRRVSGRNGHNRYYLLKLDELPMGLIKNKSALN